MQKRKIRLKGLEPLTFGSVDRRSIQLSYRRFKPALSDRTFPSPLCTIPRTLLKPFQIFKENLLFPVAAGRCPFVEIRLPKAGRRV